jgi:hypothetical protein
MKVKAFGFGLLIGLFVIGAAQSFAQSPGDDDVRGSFLTTRPKTTDKSKAPSTRRPRRRPTATTTSVNPATTDSSPSEAGAKNYNDASSKKPATAQRLGVGLTLFMRDSNGLAVRVDPNHEFHKGDLVRVLFETNSDGHLYIFNTTDGGAPVMIYPNAQLDEGGNYIQAHVPFEIPASDATEERLRWFAFDEHAGAERLYFVFTREPLPVVPIEDALLKYCGDNKKTCAWQPATELWARLQKELDTPLQVAKAKTNGRAEAPAEHDAATRGIGLAKDDPAPSLVMMNATSAAGTLVTFLELVHK